VNVSYLSFNHSPILTEGWHEVTAGIEKKCNFPEKL